MAPSALLSRSSLVVAPAGLLGGWLLLRPVGGAVEPGLWWTAAHAVWLLGFVAFVPAGLVLRRLAGPGRVAALAGAAVVLSALANVAQMAIDLVAGVRAGSRAELKAMLAAVQEIPGVPPVIYTGGAQLIFLGLLVLAVLLVVRHVVPVPAAVLVAAGVLLLAATVAVGRNGWPSPVGMAALGAGLLVVAVSARAVVPRGSTLRPPAPC